MANKGEENEIFLKAFLVKCFSYKNALNEAPAEISFIKSISFGPDIKVPLWNNIYNDLLESKNYEELKNIFGKAKASFKADIMLNGVNYSLKYGKASKSAMINHTARDGFLSVCKELNINIEPLDQMIKEYWKLRNSGKITEDVTNSMALSPFKDHKEYLKPILEYFFFKGTGKRGESSFPADKILVFTDPFAPSTYKILNPDEAVDSVWNDLTFSMRSKKGMPTKMVEGQELDAYCPEKHPLLVPWVEYRNDDAFPKGSLHIRA